MRTVINKWRLITKILSFSFVLFLCDAVLEKELEHLKKLNRNLDARIDFIQKTELISQFDRERKKVAFDKLVLREELKLNNIKEYLFTIGDKTELSEILEMMRSEKNNIKEVRFVSKVFSIKTNEIREIKAGE